MKAPKALLKAVTLTMATFLCAQAQAQTFLTNGLVAYYPFNGNANDATGRGHNGIVEGPTLTTNRFGQSDSAYYFDGTDIIDIPSAFDFNYYQQTGMTISVWAYRTADISPEHFVGRRTDGEPFYQIAIGGGAMDDSAVPIGAWTQIVLTMQNANQTFYANGHLNLAEGFFASDITSDVDVYIGGSAEYQRFIGILDDVRFYNRVLSTNEIAVLYLIESGNPFPPTFVQSPSNQVVSAGQSFTFAAQAAGLPDAPTYQWQFSTDGSTFTNINGAAGSSYSSASSGLTNIGYYRVVASNSTGTNTSSTATLSFININLLAAVYVTGPLGAQYQIQATSALGPTNWIIVTNATVTSQPYIYVDYSTPTNSKQFYRAVPQ